VSLATTADLVASAASEGTAVLAFNVITIEHAEGVADGVERAGVAALMQVSENTVSVAVPLVLHGSSGVPDDALRQAVDAGIRKLNVGEAR
jgi:fructose/tagatose bisphosphate aldolase